MNRLLMMVIACVLFICISSQLQALEEKNPFASYFMKIQRNEKKVSKMDKKKDKKKIKSMQDKISKDKSKLQKIVAAKRKEAEDKLVKLEKKLAKEQEAGRDLNPVKKQIHDQNNLLIKIEAWGKNRKPPELEKFVAKKAGSSSSKAGTGSEAGTGGEAAGSDGGFDPDAFRKMMEKDDTPTPPPPKKKKGAKAPKKKGWTWYGDTNKDGKVNEKEWLKKRQKTAKADKKPYVEDEQKEAFKKLDKNSDGSISKNEMLK